MDADDAAEPTRSRNLTKTDRPVQRLAIAADQRRRFVNGEDEGQCFNTERLLLCSQLSVVSHGVSMDRWPISVRQVLGGETMAAR